MAMINETTAGWSAWFNDLTDLTAWLRTAPKHWNGTSSTGHTQSGHSWSLGASYADALALATTGWADGVKQLDNLLVTAPRPAHEAKYVMDLAGFEPDVGRFLGGDPANMRHRRKTGDHGKQPIIKLAYNLAANHTIKAQAMANMGAAMVAIIDMLENSGRRVEVSAIWSADAMGGGRKFAAGWRVKEAQDPVDLSAVAFSIGHPAAKRRLGFAVMERCPRAMEAYNYGIPAAYRPGELPLDEDTFVVEGLSACFSSGMGEAGTLPLAMAYLAKQINKAAGETLVEVG